MLLVRSIQFVFRGNFFPPRRFRISSRRDRFAYFTLSRPYRIVLQIRPTRTRTSDLYLESCAPYSMESFDRYCTRALDGRNVSRSSRFEVFALDGDSRFLDSRLSKIVWQPLRLTPRRLRNFDEIAPGNVYPFSFFIN